MDNVHKIKSDYIPDNQSEIKPCVLLLMDLQLDSWKEFEDDPVIRLLIVDNSFCVTTKSYKVWCFSGNSSVKQCQDDQEVTHQINLWELGYSSCGHLERNHCTKVEGYLWNSFSKLQKLPFHKTPPQKVSLSLRWLRCDSETMSIVKRLSTMSSCLGGEGMWQRTCSGCHVVRPGSLCSRVCSSPGQGRGS